MEKESIVDNIRNCGCGSMNSPYRKYCGKCNTTKDEISKDIIRE
jgi:hypothetical protein